MCPSNRDIAVRTANFSLFLIKSPQVGQVVKSSSRLLDNTTSINTTTTDDNVILQSRIDQELDAVFDTIYHAPFIYNFPGFEPNSLLNNGTVSSHPSSPNWTSVVQVPDPESANVRTSQSSFKFSG